MSKNNKNPYNLPYLPKICPRPYITHKGSQILDIGIPISEREVQKDRILEWLKGQEGYEFDEGTITLQRCPIGVDLANSTYVTHLHQHQHLLIMRVCIKIKSALCFYRSAGSYFDVGTNSPKLVEDRITRSNTVASAVAINSDGDKLIGAAALQAADTQQIPPQNCIEGFKRLLGKR